MKPYSSKISRFGMIALESITLFINANLFVLAILNRSDDSDPSTINIVGSLIIYGSFAFSFTASLIIFAHLISFCLTCHKIYKKLKLQNQKITLILLLCIPFMKLEAKPQNQISKRDLIPATISLSQRRKQKSSSLMSTLPSIPSLGDLGNASPKRFGFARRLMGRSNKIFDSSSLTELGDSSPMKTEKVNTFINLDLASPSSLEDVGSPQSVMSYDNKTPKFSASPIKLKKFFDTEQVLNTIDEE